MDTLNRRIKQQIIAKRHEFFAIIQPGFEQTARCEIESFGINVRDTVSGGIKFSGKLDSCYSANLRSRTVSRVIMRLFKFQSMSFATLHNHIASFHWELYISANACIGFSVTSHASELYHTRKIEEEASKAIFNRLTENGISFRLTSSAKFTLNEDSSMQTVYIRIEHNNCSISIDTSGELLYKRGKKTLISNAPLRETIAASVLMEAGINNCGFLYDPMCGSGTFALEGAGIAAGRLPGYERNFSFMGWPSFKMPAYEHLKKKLSAASLVKSKMRICARDNDIDAVDITRKNSINSGMEQLIDIGTGDFFSDNMKNEMGPDSLLVLNPPYGRRLKESGLAEFYKKIGRKIKSDYPYSGFAIIAPSEYIKYLSLNYEKIIGFTNGGINVSAIIKHVKS
jgi:putative N6-adenine-specific DNA methylase